MLEKLQETSRCSKIDDAENDMQWLKQDVVFLCREIHHHPRCSMDRCYLVVVSGRNSEAS